MPTMMRVPVPFAGSALLKTRLASMLVSMMFALLALSGKVAAAQRPLAPESASGQTVTPAFEGWYRNADGTFSLSFGYFNRNAQEVVEVPAGPNNFITPGAVNQGQP